MPAVKGHVATVRERLELLRQLLAEPPVRQLTNAEFAAVLGPDYSEEQVKSWTKPERSGIPLEAVLRIIDVANAHGLKDVSRRWLEDGDGESPQKGGTLPPGVAAARRSGADRRELTTAPVGVSESDLGVVKRQVQLVQEAVARVVGEHEVVGVDLRKVLGRMANGLDHLGHHEAASELYALVWRLSRLEEGNPEP